MIALPNGKILEDDLVDKLVKRIIEVLADEELSIDEANAILKETRERIGETSKVKPIGF